MSYAKWMHFAKLLGKKKSAGMFKVMRNASFLMI